MVSINYHDKKELLKLAKDFCDNHENNYFHFLLNESLGFSKDTLYFIMVEFVEHLKEKEHDIRTKDI